MATVGAIEDSMVASVLLAKIRYQGKWVGSFRDLHSQITESLDEADARSPAWPKSPARFAREIHRVAPQLRLRGISITIKRETKGRRVIIKMQKRETLPT